MLGLPKCKTAFSGCNDDALGGLDWIGIHFIGDSGLFGSLMHHRLPPCKLDGSLKHLFIAILAWWSGVAFAAGQFPQIDPGTDLAADAERMRAVTQPMVVLFSQRNCGWCDRARSQLAGLAKDDPAGTGVLFRQIDIDRDTALRDFAGGATTHRQFARKHGARFTPTVMVFGPQGQPLGEPILGMRVPDFYAQYVVLAIEEARTAMTPHHLENRP